MSETRTRSDRAPDLAAVRAGVVLHQPGLVGESLRVALADAYDEWLRELVSSLPLGRGTALVAVGSLGRREPSPYGDLDLVLLHTSRGGRG
ncbi:MAG TPA: hypothetical protein VEK09_13010, partial [Jatrophihabitantaceae bacterium]|nr:hypothetical protein [Jatrophihabitantaceae bacterium]